MFWAPIIAAGISAAGSYLASKNSAGNQPTSTSSGNTSSSNYGQSTYTPNPAATPMYGFLAGNTQDLMQNPAPFFPGQTYIGPSDPTQQGINMAMGGMPYYQRGAEDMAGRAAPAYQAAAGMVPGAIAGQQGLLGTAGGNYGFLSGAADVANNPYVQAMLEQNKTNATNFLNEQALPALNNAGASVNALGSSRLGLAQGRAIGDAQRNLLENNRATQLAAYGQGLGAQQSALGQTGAMLQNQMAPAQAQAWAAEQQGNAANAQREAGQMMGAGGLQAQLAGQAVEGYQRNALQDAMDRFYYQYQQPWQNMSNVQGILQTLYPTGVTTNSSIGQGSSTSTGQNPYYTNPWQSAIGGGLAGYGAYNSYQQAK